MKQSARISIIAAVLILGIGSDQLLKQVARTILESRPVISLLGDVVRFQYAENRGMMLSIGAGLSPEVRFWGLIVGVGVLLVAMLVYDILASSLDRSQTVAWALIVSGGMGNLMDRMFRDGVVIDYVSIGIGVVRTAVFNLADVLVFAGVILLLVHRRRKFQPPAEKSLTPAGEDMVP